MLSAVARKSVTDLTRRKARAFFTVLTLAIAVASVGIFAVPALMQQAMDREIHAARLADLTLTTKPLELRDRHLRAIVRTPNVVAVQTKSVFSTRVMVGARRQKAMVIGIRDFARQGVDVVTVASGAAPATGRLLTDVQNARKDKFEGGRGAPVRVVGSDGRTRTLAVSGEGRTLEGGALVSTNSFAIFYATTATVARLSGTTGTNMIALRLHDASRPAAERTAAAVRAQLQGVQGFTGFAEYPEIREPGAYPGEELFDQIVTIMTVVTLLALLSALVLLSNTMTTLIGEQTGEIAAMKAIGGTRRQIARIYRRTALLFGGLGALTGVLLGVVLANLVTGAFARLFYGIDAGFHVDPGILLASLALGVLGPPLAALPATRRAARLPLNEALHATGAAVGGQGRLDRALRHVGLLPRSAQIGLRGAGRRKRRTLATVLQVALAVGTLLALLSLGASVADTTRAFFDDSKWDVWATTYASRPFDADAARVIAETPGVQRADPLLTNAVRIEGRTGEIWGVSPRPMYRSPIAEGRYFSAAEQRAGRPVAVVARSLAGDAGASVGDTVTLQTAAGPARLRVVGIAEDQSFQGRIVFLPIRSAQAVLRSPGQVNNYMIASRSPDHAAIDRLNTRLEDTLGATGNQITTSVLYVDRRDVVAMNSSIANTITGLGLLIVLISMVGLVNAITMGVIERTREVGMLRCIGARGRDVRRIFAVEGLVVAVLGWLVGVPLGYAMAHGIVRLTESTVGLDLTFAFPAMSLLVTLVGTLVLALLVLLAPVRRAVRLRPGDALRYA